MDSNHRTQRGQIYSLLRLTASLSHRCKDQRKYPKLSACLYDFAEICDCRNYTPNLGG
jgi:hypothetical protein